MYQDACYVPVLDKIIATRGGRIIKCNATTGEREDEAVVVTPASGHSRICYHAATGNVYVGIRFCMSDMAIVAQTRRGIFEVNPTTMVVGSNLSNAANMFNFGPWPDDTDNYITWMFSAGSYVYWGYQDTGASGSMRIDPSNTADFKTNCGLNATGFIVDQCSAGPAVAYAPEAYSDSSDSMDLASGINDGHCVVTPHKTVAAAYCGFDGLAYLVCGTQWLVRVDSYTPDAFTVYNLAAIEATADPRRIRYNSVDQKLYMPCQEENGIIIFDPSNPLTVSAHRWVSGFENPIDVVFTPSKKFAVQESPIGLKEIV